MIDKEKMFAVGLVVCLAAIIAFTFSGGGNSSGAIERARNAFAKVTAEQQRAADNAGRIKQGLNDSRGTVARIEESNNDFTASIAAAERLNNSLENTIGGAVGRVEKSYRLIDDSQRRIGECQRVLGEVRERDKENEAKK